MLHCSKAKEKSISGLGSFGFFDTIMGIRVFCKDLCLNGSISALLKYSAPASFVVAEFRRRCIFETTAVLITPEDVAARGRS